MIDFDEMEAELGALHGTIKLLCSTAYFATPVDFTFGIKHSTVLETLTGIERSVERCWLNFQGQPIDDARADAERA